MWIEVGIDRLTSIYDVDCSNLPSVLTPLIPSAAREMRIYDAYQQVWHHAILRMFHYFYYRGKERERNTPFSWQSICTLCLLAVASVNYSSSF